MICYGVQVDGKDRYMMDPYRELGVSPDMEPIMLLTFMALPVIPALKLTARGLFDSELFDFVPLEA